MRQQLFNIKFIKPSNTLKQPSKKHHTKQLPKNHQKSIITLIKQVSKKHQNHRTTKKQSTKAPKTIKNHRKHQGSIKKVKTVQNTIKKPSQYHHDTITDHQNIKDPSKKPSPKLPKEPSQTTNKPFHKKHQRTSRNSQEFAATQEASQGPGTGSFSFTAQAHQLLMVSVPISPMLNGGC